MGNGDKEDFYDFYYYQVQNNEFKGVKLYYPEYYRSLAIRLYNFDCGEVIPENTTVISYEEMMGQDGMRYKEIAGSQSFSSYKEAETYISGQETGNYRVVSDNPFVSPVPLEALEHYRLIYGSDESIGQSPNGEISEVKIFEYAGD